MPIIMHTSKTRTFIVVLFIDMQIWKKFSNELSYFINHHISFDTSSSISGFPSNRRRTGKMYDSSLWTQQEKKVI